MTKWKEDQPKEVDLEGQMSIFDFPEYLPEGELKREAEIRKQNEGDPLSPAQEYYIRTGKNDYWQASQGKEIDFFKKENAVENKPQEYTCSTCAWYSQHKGKCSWIMYDFIKSDKTKHEKGNCDDWLPNTRMFKCCETCDYCNDFEYEGEDIRHPVDGPNIYCTCSKGSKNRSCRWPDKVEKGFGVGLYHRQHEYDICDHWKLDKQWHDDCEQL